MSLLGVMGLFLLLIGGVGLIFFGVRMATRGPSVQENAEQEVREHAKKLGLNPTDVSCLDIADEEGFVGCQVRAGGQLYSYECKGKFNFGRGCRVPKLQTTVPSQDRNR